MSIRVCIKYLSLLIFLTTICMFIPVLWGIYYQESDTWWFILTIASFGLVSGLGYLATRKVKEPLMKREVLIIVVFGWFLSVAIGALPLWFSSFSNSAYNYVTYNDAFFEIMSGYTTTGASILKDVEVLPNCVQFWRHFTHWLGGLGIIVLFISLLPYLGAGGKQLFKSEVPAPKTEAIEPRVRPFAIGIMLIYTGITLLGTFLSWLGGMTLLEAFCHTFAAIATGGFSTYNASIGHYHSYYLEWVMIVLMILGGANFTLYYYFFKGKFLIFFKDPEFRVYILLWVSYCALVIINLIHVGFYKNFQETFRNAVFSVTTINSTTGFYTADFDQFPSFSKFIIYMSCFTGACCVSTGGGIKIFRIIVLVKSLIARIRAIFNPYLVDTIRVGSETLDQKNIDNILYFFALYIFVFVLSSLYLTGTGLDWISATTGVAACLNTTGPGLGIVGPTQNFSSLADTAKAVLSLDMFFGRLEILPILVFLYPSFWKIRRDSRKKH